MRRALVAAFLALAACAPRDEASRLRCDISLIVLGVAQDAGKPQIGHPEDAAWRNRALRRLPTSLALVDRRGATPVRFLIEATPAIVEQIEHIDRAAPVSAHPGLDGVFITHAHIGHYAGLMMLGHEAAGAENIPVYVMPKMADFLQKNGPWSQLVRYQNITLAIMAAGEPEIIGNDLTITPFLVPHRQEFSEVAGFLIKGPNASALFIPDIDRWEELDAQGVKIEELLKSVDVAFLDGTFFSGGELPGRDMSKIPHPLVSTSLGRFAPLPARERQKIRFIHFNHTNPLNDPASREAQAVKEAGARLSSEGEETCL